MKTVALIGPPACGKSTIMRAFLATLGNGNKFPFGESWGNLYVLGRYEDGEKFPGTDRLPMNVQPAVVAFIRTLPDSAVLVFEGDRLTNSSFLSDCKRLGAVHILLVDVSSELLDVRYRARNSPQNASWRRGRETKIIKMALKFSEDVVTVPNYSEADVGAAVLKLREVCGG